MRYEITLIVKYYWNLPIFLYQKYKLDTIINRHNCVLKIFRVER